MSDPRPYPPDSHLLSDLGFQVDRRGGEPRVTLPVSAALLDAGGSVRAGVLGLVLDVCAGGLAVEAARPDWALTSDLSVHRLRPCASGGLVATGRALRAGRTQLVVEALVRSDADPPEAGPLAFGHIAFTRVPRRADTPPSPDPGASEGVYTFGGAGTPLSRSLLRALDVVTEDAATGHLVLPLGDYVRNSVGGLQGGVVVVLLDASATTAASDALGAPAVVTDLSTRYLALSREGPVHVVATPLRRDPAEMLLRVELRDTGQDDRVVSVGTAIARIASAG